MADGWSVCMLRRHRIPQALNEVLEMAVSALEVALLAKLSLTSMADQPHRIIATFFCKRLHDFFGCSRILARDVYIGDMMRRSWKMLEDVGRCWKHIDELNTGPRRVQNNELSWYIMFTGCTARCTDLLWTNRLQWPMMFKKAQTFLIKWPWQTLRSRVPGKLPWERKYLDKRNPGDSPWFNSQPGHSSNCVDKCVDMAESIGLAGSSTCRCSWASHVMQTQLLHRCTLVRNWTACFVLFQHVYVILYRHSF